MKNLYIVCFCFLAVCLTNAQERYLTKSGEITFFSESPLENIAAKNSQVLSIVDAGKKQMAISILMKSFMFEKALMQEHFNENYVESDKYPKATFRGAILNFDTITDKETKVEVKGKLTIHGITKEMVIKALAVKKDNAIVMQGDFFITLSDFNVDIPSVVEKNIAKEIKVSFNFNHQPFKK
ncbi:YceI family protein [uncultured Polaribacter sp.]|uniref:YceI family protein n=1 Tax=uncultured Polaribacter sp. TaxID=174711 RepID=UPI00260F6F2B|nr:YceI family protein [uncultured Polaribacter sp.]